MVSGKRILIFIPVSLLYFASMEPSKLHRTVFRILLAQMKPEIDFFKELRVKSFQSCLLFWLDRIYLLTNNNRICRCDSEIIIRATQTIVSNATEFLLLS